MERVEEELEPVETVLHRKNKIVIEGELDKERA